MTMNGRRSQAAQAFTMIELMLVISIMMIIGLLAALGIAEVVEHAKVKETESTIHLLELAIEQFKADMGTYPEPTRDNGGVEENFIDALIDPSSGYGWQRASLAAWFPNRRQVKDIDSGRPRMPDAWDIDIEYCRNDEYDAALGTAVERTPGKKDYYNLKTFQLYSCGPNMKTFTAEEGGHARLCGTEPDDIRNWVQETFYDTLPAAYAP